MAGLTDVANLCIQIGASALSAAAAVDEARASQAALNDEIERAEARETTSSMTKAGGGATDTKKLAASLQSIAGRV